MEETSNTQGRMEASSEGGQGPKGAVALWKKKEKMAALILSPANYRIHAVIRFLNA